MNYRYKVIEVEAWRVANVSGTQTQAIPPHFILDGVWKNELHVLDDGAIQIQDKGKAANLGDWIVKKPDGSLGIYTHLEFQKEFESIPEVRSK